MSRPFVQALMLVATCALGSDAPAVFAQQAPPGVQLDAQTLADFQTRINQYVDIHKKIEATLPRLPESATPEQIDRNQRELSRLIRVQRAAARQGDIFGSAMELFVRRLIGGFLTGPSGLQLRSSIMDENPQDIVVRVNDRYPEGAPLSTMPPQILDALPKMPEDLQFRFIGEDFVIVDNHAYIIADFVPAVLRVAQP